MWHGENLSYSIESFSARLNVLRFAIYFVIGIILFRIISLQIISGDRYRKISDENRIVIYPQPASRGKIFDRNNEIIVDNKPSFVVLFSRQTLSDEEVKNVITKVSSFLSLPVDTLLEKVKMTSGRNFTLVKIAENISKNQALRLAEKMPQLPGVVVRVEPVRVYKWNNISSHLTGYVREVSLDELDRLPKIKSGDVIGKNGIEKQYDEILRGINGGSQVEVNARGIQKRIIETVESVDGDSLVLTIDKKVQDALSRNLEGHVGIAIAIDPNNGDVLGLASYPNYNPNLFISKIPNWQLSYYLESKQRPLWDRTIQGQYPPGSIYKIVTAVAGLESGEITPETVINCKGFIELGKYKQKFRCWAREGHGDISLVSALAHSCDVFFYDVGLKLGPTILDEWAKKFGFGEKTDIDLPFEEKGLIPDKVWKKERLHQDWYDGDTVNMSVGQGYIWTTPIQVAQFMSAVANEGTVFKPNILKKIIDTNGNVKFESFPEIKWKVNVSPSTFNIIKKGLAGVAQYGTAKGVHIPGLSVGGKTGTAQNPQGADHAWFVCFAPLENPKIALVVMVEHGGSGGEVAAPLAGKMLAEIFNKHVKTETSKEVIIAN
ncbi:MAG: penicillin-binding protein 2 [Elusimicrobia bacterium]|nr:penicillin-binding protein 2 [Elusimicrobiota bacterium]